MSTEFNHCSQKAQSKHGTAVGRQPAAMSDGMVAGALFLRDQKPMPHARLLSRAFVLAPFAQEQMPARSAAPMIFGEVNSVARQVACWEQLNAINGQLNSRGFCCF
jgi:hypothetical protein